MQKYGYISAYDCTCIDTRLRPTIILKKAQSPNRRAKFASKYTKHFNENFPLAKFLKNDLIQHTCGT